MQLRTVLLMTVLMTPLRTVPICGLKFCYGAFFGKNVEMRISEANYFIFKHSVNHGAAFLSFYSLLIPLHV